MADPTTGLRGTAPQGVVVATQANYYRVRLFPETLAHPSSAEPHNTSLLCTRRARLKKIGQRVMVGDVVQLEGIDWAGQRGAIAAVQPRQSVLDRPSVANADQILLVFALAEPALDPQQLSRFLVKAEFTGLRLNLCFSKRDLVDAATWQRWQEQVAQWGYSATAISLREQSYPRDLIPLLQGQVTVVSGPSGVGKSSLINGILPEVVSKTGLVSGKLGRGRHTTRHVELFELPGGGFLADTPGFNQPDLTGLTAVELGQGFPEIRQRLAQQPCQFRNCLHQGELGCAVGNDWPRYAIYSTLLEEIQAQQRQHQRRPDPDEAVKTRVLEQGRSQQQPRLEAKRYRRPSRRRQRQHLDQWQQGISPSPSAAADPEDLDGSDWLAPSHD